MTETTHADRAFSLFLSSLDEPGLEAAAEYHEQLARTLRLRLAERRHWREMKEQAESKNKERTARRAALPRILAQHIVAGQSIEAAIDTVSKTSGFHIDLVADEWRKWTRTKETDARNERHALVMSLAATCRNAEIAARTGFHPNSVSRIIQKHLKPPSRP